MNGPTGSRDESAPSLVMWFSPLAPIAVGALLIGVVCGWLGWEDGRFDSLAIALLTGSLAWWWLISRILSWVITRTFRIDWLCRDGLAWAVFVSPVVLVVVAAFGLLATVVPWVGIPPIVVMLIVFYRAFRHLTSGELQHLARLGDASGVDRLLQRGFSIDYRNSDGVTPLLAAVAGGHAEIVRRLLAVGAAVDARDHDGQTALLIAAAAGRADLVRLLLAGGADPDLRDLRGWSALHRAVAGNQSAAAVALMAAGVDANLRVVSDDPHLAGCRPLHLASSLRLTQILILYGADPNGFDDQGWVPLQIAAADPERVATLCGAGADPNRFSLEADGLPSLHLAIAADAPDAAAVLLDFGADPGQPGDPVVGSRPLHLAATRADPRAVHLLLDRGADPNIRDTNWNTPLAVALSLGRADVARALVDRGANVQSGDKVGITPLHWAARLGDRDLLTRLLALGADPHARDDDGDTPRDWAERAGHPGLLELLPPE